VIAGAAAAATSSRPIERALLRYPGLEYRAPRIPVSAAGSISKPVKLLFYDRLDPDSAGDGVSLTASSP